jgi:hypothetical protein
MKKIVHHCAAALCGYTHTHTAYTVSIAILFYI